MFQVNLEEGKRIPVSKRIREATSDLIKFEGGIAEFKDITPYSIGLSSGDVSFIVVGDGTDLKHGYKHVLPSSITFILYVEGANPPRLDPTHSLSIHRVIVERMADRVPVYSCGNIVGKTLQFVVDSNIEAMLDAWVNADKLNDGVQKMTSYATSKFRQCDTITDRLVYPFNTSGVIDCNKIAFRVKGAESECKDMIDQLKSANLEAVQFCESNELTFEYGLLADEVDTKAVQSTLKIVVILASTEVARASGLVDTLKILQGEASEYDADIFTVVVVPATSSAFTYLNIASKCTTYVGVNYALLSSDEKTANDLTNIVYTALGTTKINRHRALYADVTDADYKAAVESTRKVVVDSGLKSETLISALQHS